MIRLAYIERNIEYAIEYVKARKKGSEYESLLTYLSGALDELREGRPVKESGEVTCTTGDKRCPYLVCRRLAGNDYFCTASHHGVAWLFYDNDNMLVPQEDCVWK